MLYKNFFIYRSVRDPHLDRMGLLLQLYKALSLPNAEGRNDPVRYRIKGRA